MKEPKYEKAYEALEEEFILASAVIDARNSAVLTQQELARRMGTTQPIMAHLESGRVRPSMRTLERLAEATGSRPLISFEPRELKGSTFDGAESGARKGRSPRPRLGTQKSEARSARAPSAGTLTHEVLRRLYVRRKSAPPDSFSLHGGNRSFVGTRRRERSLSQNATGAGR
jgi:transcriptional regulator with XRE-family HTH domain